MNNENISDISNSEISLNAYSLFEIIDFAKKICHSNKIVYSTIFQSEDIKLLIEKILNLQEDNKLLYSKYLSLLSNIAGENISIEDRPHIFLKILFYPARLFELIHRDFEIAYYDTRIELFRKRVLDDYELRHQECSKPSIDWFEPDWWRIFVFRPLRESGISQEWLMSNDLKTIVQEWTALQVYSELKAAIDFDDKVEREIDLEANKPVTATVDGKEVSFKARNIRFQKQQLRKRYYKKK